MEFKVKSRCKKCERNKSRTFTVRKLFFSLKTIKCIMC